MSRRLVHDEQGVALVLALIAMTVLSISAAGILTAVAVNHHTSYESMNARRAFGLAEVGLAYAEGRVYGAAAAHTTPLGSATTVSQDGGTVTYWASVAADGHTWTMFGRGTYGGVTREASSQTNVPGPTTVQDTGVWNYLYADSTSTACPTTVGGSTTVAVPMFVRGNLCLGAPFTGAQLGVGGNLVMQSGGKIGTSTRPISSLAVKGTCSGVTAGTGVCNGKTNPIYANSVSPNLQINPGLPAIDLPNIYSTANPGPGTGHGCQTGSGVPNPFFDNDTTLNKSLASINLFPSSNYDCINGSNEIKWTASTKTLYVNGTFLFDGSLSLSGNSHVVYSGSGSIYITGTISVSGGISVCGSATCGTDWDTGTAALVLVAACWNNSTGTQLVSKATTGSYCINLGGNSVWQAAFYCATDYFIAGTATNWGPVLAQTLTLNGNLSELVPFKVMPPGTPMNTSTSYLPASAPTYWSG